jgi:hypothetical protein
MVRNDQLSLMQELVGHAHAIIEQPAGILSQDEDQSLELAGLEKAIE